MDCGLGVLEYLQMIMVDGFILSMILFTFLVVLPCTFLLVMYAIGLMLRHLIDIIRICLHGVMAHAREILSCALGGISGVTALVNEPWFEPHLFMMCVVTYLYCSLKSPGLPRTFKIPRTALALLLIFVLPPITTEPHTTTTTPTTSTTLSTQAGATPPVSSVIQPSFATSVSLTSSDLSTAAASSTTSTSSATSQPAVLTAIMVTSTNVKHNAPAGQKYSTIRDAGEQTLATYCQGFPQSPDRESFILPILFKSEHPENVKEDDGSLSEADKRSLTGLNINIRGERGEYEVYKAFYTVVRQSPTESILVLHGYRLDNDNGRNLKRHAIISELPTIDLSGVNMRKEHDFVVVVRYVGIVLCEVKTSASAENIASAESQLQNSETFVQQILTAIAGPTSPQLPVVKVIIVPNEPSTPSAPKKHNQCHIVYQDDLQNFASKWTQIVEELKRKAHITPSNCFENLVQFLVGVWSMKPLTKKTYDFDNNDASLSTNVEAIDSAVNKAEFAPTKQAQKLTKDVATSLNEIFRRVDEMNIMYLSPQQKSLYDNYRHALIHSHAGAGKTMLVIFKIIELLENDSTQKVLLVAPKPHHFRLQNILSKHNITTDIVSKFPYNKPASSTSQLQLPPPTCDVLIIALQDFFGVPRETLMQYDVSMFNIFVDDTHAYKVPKDHGDNNICTFRDVGDFIDNCYNLLNTMNQYAWFGFDVVQQGQWFKDINRRSDRLFVTSNGNPRTFAIPIVTMTNVLRSTKEITDVIDTARQIQMNYNKPDTNHVISDIGCGHHITTGTRVLYEKLQQGTNEKHHISFVCDRVCAFLLNLTSATSPHPNNFPLATVAILSRYGGELQEYKPSLQSMIKQQFNVGVQSIEQQLHSNNNNDIIIDHCGNIQSFESPTVVYVRKWDDNDVLYNSLSRARTQCVVVDVVTKSTPLKLQHIDVVTWKEVNGAFQKV